MVNINDYLNQDDFPNCCGGVVITEFPKERLTKKEKNALKKKLLSNEYEDIGFGVVALNGKQKEFLEETLLECGYKCVLEGANNPNHGTLLYLYAKDYKHPTLESKPSEVQDWWK